MSNTPSFSNVNACPRMLSAVLPGNMILRMPEGIRCWCGGRLRCDPEALDRPGSFRLIGDCHHDVMIVERQP
jgi:hypothetical protein